MKLSDLGDALQQVIPDVFHYEAWAKPDKYIVWAEDAESNASYADNHKTDQVIQGTIDYFTKTEFDNTVVLIQHKLNSIDVAWQLSSIQHEKDTGYIHYEWIFELEGELI